MPWTRLNLPEEAERIVSAAPSFALARSVNKVMEPNSIQDQIASDHTPIIYHLTAVRSSLAIR